MARTRSEPAPIVRPPLTPNDAARVAGTFMEPPRPDFLRQTVDVIDRADLDGKDALERLHRFVQDWQHHAKAKMLVELGETLDFLTQTLPSAEDGMEAQEVRDALEKLDVDSLGREERNRRFGELLKNDELVSDLANHYCVNAATAVDDLRKKLIDDAPSADEASGGESVAEVRAELEQAMSEVESLKQANAEIRAERQDVSKRLSEVQGALATVREKLALTERQRDAHADKVNATRSALLALHGGYRRVWDAIGDVPPEPETGA